MFAPKLGPKLAPKLVTMSAALGAVCALVLAACSDTKPTLGPPTQSVCADGSTLTYESFAKPFMEAYCTRCHARTVVGADREGAPSFHDFDSLSGIKVVFDHIDQTTASGPAATNEGMPPDGPTPSLAERKQLGEWIACGMP
jgi:hypothetical protein